MVLGREYLAQRVVIGPGGLRAPPVVVDGSKLANFWSFGGHFGPQADLFGPKAYIFGARQGGLLTVILASRMTGNPQISGEISG